MIFAALLVISVVGVVSLWGPDLRQTLLRGRKAQLPAKEEPVVAPSGPTAGPF